MAAWHYPPDPRLRVSVIVPVYHELSNGNVYRLLQGFVEQDVDCRTFAVVFVVNNTPQDAREHNAAFVDNQHTLGLGHYINTPCRAAHPPAFVPDAQATLLTEVCRTGVQLHFLDRSSTGMARNMGRIRNQGILLALNHFETLGIDGLIANLDADTAIPENYISQLAYLATFPHIHVVYPHLTWRFQGTEDRLFARYMQIMLPHQYRACCLNLFEPAQSFVGGPQIAARAHVWKRLGGFPEVDRGEDIRFAQAVRKMAGVVSVPGLTVESQVRVRDIGFMSQTLATMMRHSRTGQDTAEISQSTRTPYILIRVLFGIQHLNRVLTTPGAQASLRPPGLLAQPVLQAIAGIFAQYQLRFTERAWHLWLATQAREPVMNTTDFQAYFMPNTASTVGSLKSNVLDFMEHILVPRADASARILQEMIAHDVQDAEREIQRFQNAIHTILHAAYAVVPAARPQAVLAALHSSPNALIHMLSAPASAEISTLSATLARAVLRPDAHAAFAHLRTLYPDWLHGLSDTPFREDWVYLQAFEKFICLAKHRPALVPGMHALLVEVSGHHFTTYV